MHPVRCASVNLRKVCNYISHRSKTDFQCIVISLKDMFYERSDSLVGVCRDVGTSSSRTLTLDLTTYDKQMGVKAEPVSPSPKKKRKVSKSSVEEDDSDAEEDAASPSPKKSQSKKKRKSQRGAEDEDIAKEDEAASPSPQKKRSSRSRSRRSVAAAEETDASSQ